LAEICRYRFYFVIKIIVALDGIHLKFYLFWSNEEPRRNSYPNDSRHWELVKGAEL
jgi:hypothetical protein